MKDRTEKYEGGVQQHNMFHHLSYKNKLLGNTSYPRDVIVQEHSITQTSTSSDSSSSIGKIVQQEKLPTLDIVSVFHLSSKCVGVTCLFISTVDRDDTIGGFRMCEIFKDYKLE